MPNFLYIGSELRAWLLYYCLPVLHNVLPDLYYDHLSLLVGSVHILLSTEIHQSQLRSADMMLDDFYTRAPILYGKFCTCMLLYVLII